MFGNFNSNILGSNDGNIVPFWLAASIYSAYSAMNTGLDAILDVSNLVVKRNPIAQVARSLIKFDQGEINNLLENIAQVTGSASWGTWDAHLKLYVAKPVFIAE